MARDYGYKIIEVTNAVEFNKVKGTFDSYIKDIYNSKKIADKKKNDVLSYIFKSDRGRPVLPGIPVSLISLDASSGYLQPKV